MDANFRLKEVRRSKAISQKELAKRINVSQATISKWENKFMEPNLLRLVDLALALKVSTDYLIGLKD